MAEKGYVNELGGEAQGISLSGQVRKGEIRQRYVN